MFYHTCVCLQPTKDTKVAGTHNWGLTLRMAKALCISQACSTQRRDDVNAGCCNPASLASLLWFGCFLRSAVRCLSSQQLQSSSKCWQVSSLGRVRSTFGVISRGTLTPEGYCAVRIGRKTWPVHRVVKLTHDAAPQALRRGRYITEMAIRQTMRWIIWSTSRQLRTSCIPMPPASEGILGTLSPGLLCGGWLEVMSGHIPVRSRLQQNNLAFPLEQFREAVARARRPEATSFTSETLKKQNWMRKSGDQCWILIRASRCLGDLLVHMEGLNHFTGMWPEATSVFLDTTKPNFSSRLPGFTALWHLLFWDLLLHLHKVWWTTRSSTRETIQLKTLSTSHQLRTPPISF